MRGAIAVVAVTAGAVIAALIVGLATSGRHETGSNQIAPQAYVATVDPGRRLCQSPELVPAGSGSLELNVGTYGRPGPPLEVMVGGNARGNRGGGYHDGWVRVPFAGAAADRRRPEPAPDVCVRNAGRTRIAVAGELAPPGQAARVAGRPAQGLVTLRWRSAHATTWWGDAGTVAERVTFGKADLGPWTPALLLVLVWAGAFALVLRSART
jgi:hypothetical protein